jgi:NADH dehydrogenase
MIPGDGSSLLQPIWIHDVVSCLLAALENEQFAHQTLSIGGLEPLTFRQVVEMVMTASSTRRRIVSVSPATMRIIALFTEMFHRFPVSIFWLDYLSANRTTALDSLPRMFGILPARFHNQLGYLAKPAKPILKQRGSEG